MAHRVSGHFSFNGYSQYSDASGIIASPWLAVSCLLLFTAVLVGIKALYKEFVNPDDQAANKPLPLVTKIATNDYREPAETMNAQQAYWVGVSCSRAGQFSKSILYFERAAEQPEQDGTHIFALIRCHQFFGGRKKKQSILPKLEASIGQLIQLADSKNVEAQRCLGYCYEEGIGVPRDMDKALKYYCEAAAQDDSMAAQYELGMAYHRFKNYAKAVEHVEFSANKGYVLAQYRVGLWCATVYPCVTVGGGKQDFTRALEYFCLAADQGHVGAQHMMGLYCLSGQGVTQDYGNAVKFFKKAADQGDERAKRDINHLIQGGIEDYHPILL